MIFAGCERFGWFMKLFLFFGFLIFRMFFKSRVLFMYEAFITIFTEFGFSFSPLFSYQRLDVGEKKNRRQGRFRSLTKIIKRKGGNFLNWIPDQVRNDDFMGIINKIKGVQKVSGSLSLKKRRMYEKK